jgi:hypothetical protein
MAGTDETIPIASDHLQIVNVGVVIAHLLARPCSSGEKNAVLPRDLKPIVL